MQNLRALCLFLASLLFLSAVYWVPQLFEISTEKAGAAFQEKLWEKENELEIELNNLIKQHENSELYISKKYFSNSLFVFNKEKILYWNEDQTGLNNNSILTDEPVFESSNAFHKKIIRQKGDFTYVGLITILRSFPFQNKFLRNKFVGGFKVKPFEKIQLNTGDFEIKSQNGERLFYLSKGPVSKSKAVILFSLFCLIICIYLLLIAVPNELSKNRVLIAIGLAIGLRVYLFFYLPSIFSGLKLFQSDWFAISQLAPNLGDFLLHILTVLYVLYQLRSALRVKRDNILIINSLLLYIGLNFFSIKLISWSVASSVINYNLTNLFGLNYLSFIVFSCFCILFLCNFLVGNLALRLIHNKTERSNSYKIILLTCAFIIIIAAIRPFQELIYLWGIPVLFALNRPFTHPQKQPIVSILVCLLLSSSIISYWMNHELGKRDDLQQKSIIKKLAEERDPIAEYLFNELQEQLINDEYIRQNSANYWSQKEAIDTYIKKTYFNSYWDKYQINFSLCSNNDSLIINGDQNSCFTYFQKRIRLEGDMVSSNNLFQLTNYAGRIDYIGEVDYRVDSLKYRLYIELSSIYLNENEGYPELLLDEKSINESIDLAHYSYAVYNKNDLVYKNGAYNYSTQLKFNEISSRNFYQYKTANYHHLAFQKDRNVTLLLSKKSKDYFDFLTSLAYISVILSLLFSICALVLSNFPFHYRVSFSDFSTKIQLFLVLSLLSSLVLLAWGTTYYIKKQYEEKNGRALEEKIRSVSIELDGKIGKEEFLSDALNDYISNYLIKFSNVFYSDINIYNTNGQLYSTSRPEVFLKGIKSDRMNPDAYKAMHVDKKAQWVQNERIGKLNYLSAYIPFKNYDNEVLGYLNLPYFSKQNELEEEISAFLVSTLNIYVAVFALALLISVLLINQLSKPLLLIRKQIAKLKIGSSIELIEWKSKDEIGVLVNEYNRIAVELSDSAEQLAKSEREVAWREMAKQVAHEIKNPLTPMKLSIQHLQRSAQMNSDDLKERINRTTNILIEQIETLSNIATAFSSFAKLPSKNYIELDLIPVLINTIDLYSNTISIDFEKEQSLDVALIKGDKDQVLRVLNNIIKNAVQAAESAKIPQLAVSISKTDTTFKISVKDNGAGISPEQADRIFEPNFTTKSSGTGLGLAMSKSIVEQMDGEITFNSVENQETTFTIELPKA
ncbi:MAG: GHKL domain-containing protein [Flavobacteriales bacterium]|nr:GHKL domain-containing protein [Flavobacteriales bacterium]